MIDIEKNMQLWHTDVAIDIEENMFFIFFSFDFIYIRTCKSVYRSEFTADCYRQLYWYKNNIKIYSDSIITGDYSSFGKCLQADWEHAFQDDG